MLSPLIFNTILVIIPLHKCRSFMGIMELVIKVEPAVGLTVSGLILKL
ncbi:drug resistance transporter, EmrB/QacA family [Priestia megaterium]|nr:drug resistance transporter, EmrB/QacA family [Priestia megaterium]